MVWEKCCHGLTSRPRETSSVWFLDELLFLFGYPVASGAHLLAGTLPLRYFSESFAHKVPAWRLPGSGHVAIFFASGELVWGGPSALSAALVVLVFAWLKVLVEALKESDYTEKHQHTLLDRLFRWSRFVLGFGRGFGILVFLVLSF